MCGIAGFLDFNSNSNQQVLEAMTHALQHRGPDGQGIYLAHTQNAQVGLGHRRLSIIDLTTSANQPMHFNGLHIIFNGEIYNYNEIREELISAGHHFVTHSDTEVILHAWQEWGEDAVKQWRGMFSIVLYDENKQDLICIRDRAGVKPFYYYWNKGVFIFGSELKSINIHPAFEKKIDLNAVASFLQYGYVCHPHCIYQNTFKLLPGHILRFNLNSQEFTLKQYWNVYDYYNKPKLTISLEDAIDETERILTESFQYRMVADVPVGVFLSGGYDSSCVTALLQKNKIEKIKTFTIGLADEKMNEAPYAQQIARHLGTDHVEYRCTPQEALTVIPQLPYYYDEPFADSSAIPTIVVSRLAREKVTVALSADAGDEIFAGYNKYEYITRYQRQLGSLPKPLKRIAAAVLENVSSENIPYFRNQHRFHGQYDRLRSILNSPSPLLLPKHLSQIFSRKDITNLFVVPIRELDTAHASMELRNEFHDPVTNMMVEDYQVYLVDDILQKVDRATMSASLEGREPFLDQHIIEWAAQLPTIFKYRLGQKKYILKQIVHKYIPKEIMDRPKIGFQIPLESWLGNELKELVKEYLSTESIKIHGLFNDKEVQSLVNSFYNGRTEKYLKIWHLLMFQMWYRKWND